MNDFDQPRPPRLRPRLARILLLCAATYLGISMGCASCQRRMIYFPPIFDAAKTDELGAAANLERWRDAAGDPIGWKRFSPTQPAVGAVLVLHGNAGCAVQCGHYADVIQQAAALDVFIAEYPGYADRPGKPTERTLEQTAAEALQLLNTNQPVYVVGESLGTGVACHLAGEQPARVTGVVLLAPYSSLTDVAKAHLPLFPVRWLLCDRYPAEDYLKNYHGPIAMLVAESDSVVPAKFSRRLYEGYAGPKRLWEFPQGDHGTVMEQPATVWRRIFDFLEDEKPATTGG